MVIKTEKPITKVNNIIVNTDYLQTVNCNVIDNRDIKYIVLHYTGNSKDTAKANANYFLTAGINASAHYFVDEKSIYQSVALKDISWHCGSKKYYHSSCRNSNSIGVEMCCSGNYTVSKITQDNASYLVAELCKLIGISAKDVDTYVLRHYDISHKSCPKQWISNESEFIAFKESVKKLLSPPTTSTILSNKFKVGDTVRIVSGAKYISGIKVPSWLLKKMLYVRKLNGNNATISTLKTGSITGVINTKYLVKDEILPSNNFESYKVKVNTNSLNIRKNAGTNYTIIGKITDKGVYTIVNEKSGQGATKWLELKSGGYISADYVKRV